MILSFGFLFNLSIWQYIALSIEILIFGFWLWIGEELNHVVCGGPLSGYGYDRNFDNLCKCSLLFIVLMTTIFYYSHANEIFSLFGVVMIISIIVCAISSVCRSIFGWVS